MALGPLGNRLVNAIIKARPGQPDLLFCVSLVRNNYPSAKQLHRLLTVAHKYREKLPEDLAPPFKPPPLDPLGEFYAIATFKSSGRSIEEGVRLAVEHFGQATDYFSRWPDSGRLPDLGWRRYG